MFGPFGAQAFGLEPLAGDPLHDPPSVALDPLGVVNSDGPVLTVSWFYSQPQGDAQEWYRVQLLDDAGEVSFYDSGWLASDDVAHEIDVDAESVPHDTDDIMARVQVRGPEAIGVGDLSRFEASDDDPFEIQWGVPHCTITDPADGSIYHEPSGLTVDWTFSDDRAGKFQRFWRARLLLGGQVEHDTGWVEGLETSYEFPVALRDGSTYDIEVQLKNQHGIRSD